MAKKTAGKVVDFRQRAEELAKKVNERGPGLAQASDVVALVDIIRMVGDRCDELSALCQSILDTDTPPDPAPK